MNKELKLTVNGQPYELSVKPKTLLVEVLRNHLDLTGTKRGCESSSCGACTVILNGMAVKSCSILALQADGAEIVTIEGLARGEKLHPLQRAFLDYGAYQCGFCTAGMLVVSKALLDKNPHPTRKEIKQAISGNLCRCTGYGSIVDAIEATAREMEREHKAKCPERF